MRSGPTAAANRAPRAPRASRVKSRPARRDYCAPAPGLEELVRELWEALHGRTMRWDQREQVATEISMYVRLVRNGKVDLTLDQWCLELGLPIDGLSYDQIDDKYGMRRRRHDEVLVELGLLKDRELVLRDGTREVSYTLVRVPAGVAQSVRAARGNRTPVRLRQPLDGSSFSGQVLVPLRAFREQADFGPSSPSLTLCADAREAETRARAHVAARVRAALVEQLNNGDEGKGAGVLDRVPWLRSVPVDILAIQAWRIRYRDGRLSKKWRDDLFLRVEQLDRLGLDGRAEILDVALFRGCRAFQINDKVRKPREEDERPEFRRGSRDHRARSMAAILAEGVPQAPAPRFTPPSRRGVLVRTQPRTAGGLAVCVRRIARAEVRKARRRRAVG